MNRNQKHPASCIDGTDHNWFIARQRGTRVRHQCRTCSVMDRWVKDPGYAVVVPIIDETVNATFWNGATVADLKAMAKERGLTGYSKMKRDDLIEALA